MKKKNHYIYGVHVTERLKSAIDVQKVLTEFGCLIKTRLGLHELSDRCESPNGLLILEMEGDEKRIKQMVSKLKKIQGIDVKGMIFDHKV
ncbi:MAG: hypothetical protein JW808_04455 [Victivallales bacterium]|nr:hypothetical protein [Victivallales bacterium]